VTYQEAFSAFDGGIRQVLGEQGTAGIFATYPQPYLSTLGGFVDQVVGTALLMIAILAITDQRNNATPAWLTPIIVGGIVVAIGVSFGFNAGYAINPARDFGPRLFTALAGWGSGVFTAASAWWWVPVIAPCIGAVAGAVGYDVLITNHHPHQPTPTASPEAA
jgi:glycerol uptake facilitator-like aquaporin